MDGGDPGRTATQARPAPAAAEADAPAIAEAPVTSPEPACRDAASVTASASTAPRDTPRAAPDPAPPSGLLDRLARAWTARLADPGFQARVARVPVLRRMVAREGAEMFDLVAGFVRSQVLLALVELDVLEALRRGPVAEADLARHADLPPDRAAILFQAGAALGLLRRRRDGTVALARRGAALIGVPGLPAMIAHHRVLYRDLADPVALLRGQGATELAAFWPYVFGAGAATDPATARRYSDLMADSQMLVAQDTLATGALADTRHLLDVGGGTGAFVAACCTAHPHLRATLFDLPQVVAEAGPRLAAAGVSDRVTPRAGSFRDDPLPEGADTIALIRVLYDHGDATVAALLAKVFAALPPGGRLVISEPMAGTPDRPDAAGDVYFALYTLAMGTGRARSQARIAALCRAAGFTDLRTPRAARPYVTSVVTARRPG